MTINARTSLSAVAVLVGCVLLVTIRVALAPAPPRARAATVEERWEIANTMASNESAWSNETVQNFPGDHWSQRDDFHGREYHKAVELAKTKGLRIEDILRAIDDDIHRRRARRPDDRDDRSARAVPCKPRPFYD